MCRAIGVVLDAQNRVTVPIDDARWLASQLRRMWSGRLLTPALEAAVRLEGVVTGSTPEPSIRFSRDEAPVVTAVLRAREDELTEPLRELCQWLTDHPTHSFD
jgi:hypothetical protein